MKHPMLTRAAQGVAAMILTGAGVMKFMGGPLDIQLFASLGMEPGGRYLIGVIEVLAAMLLLSPFAALGSVLAVGVMFGAIIAHLTQLGLIVNDDGGSHVGMLVLVLLSSGYVLFSRRKEVPLVGKTL